MPDNASLETLLSFREGAEEGYLEVIGMGQPISETSPIAVLESVLELVLR